MGSPILRVALIRVAVAVAVEIVSGSPGVVLADAARFAFTVPLQQPVSCLLHNGQLSSGRVTKGRFESYAKVLSDLKRKRLHAGPVSRATLAKQTKKLLRLKGVGDAVCSELGAGGVGNSRSRCDAYDLNRDRRVNRADLAVLLTGFGTSRPSPDADGDGMLGLSELSNLLSCLGANLSSAQDTPGATPTASPSPTPTSTPPPSATPQTPGGDFALDFTARLVAHPGWRITQVDRPRLFRLAVVHQDDYQRNVPLTYSIHRTPAHGTLAGSAPNLIYVPNPGFVGEDSLQYSASDGQVTSNIATVYFNVLEHFVPPLGIPMPGFGISERHTMYTGQRFDFDGDGVLESGEEYRIGPNGPYTHYVDNTDPNATDANNPFGTVNLPRRGIPTEVLRAGSVVEIHGSGYTYGGYFPLKGQGTASRPVFIRGGSAVSMPRINDKISIWSNEDSNRDGQQNDIVASYMIFEYLSAPKIEVNGPAHHIAIRDVEVTGGGGTSVGGPNASKTASDILFLRLNSHDTGNWRLDVDADDGYNFIAGNASNVWHLDGQATRAQSNGYHYNGQGPSAHHLYTGRCESWQNKQASFALKTAWHVIYSENTAHDSAPRAAFPSGHPSDWGAGFGLQYNPAYVYYLHNTVYNNSVGFAMGSGGGPQDAPQQDQKVYFIRNNVFDIRRMNEWNDPAQPAMEPGNPYSNVTAFHMRGMAHRFLVGNTIHRAVAGINNVGSVSLTIQDNIVSAITESLGHHFISVLTGSVSSKVIEHNLFFQPDAGARFGWDNDEISLPAFRTRTSSCQSCFEVDPQFSNAEENDVTLRSSSPAVDAGVLDPVYQEFESRYGLSIRTDDGHLDLGAFER